MRDVLVTRSQRAEIVEAVRAGGRVRRGRLQFGHFARIDVELPVRINPVVQLDRERLTRRALRVVVADRRVRVVAVDVGVFRPRDVDLLEVREVRRGGATAAGGVNDVPVIAERLRPAARANLLHDVLVTRSQRAEIVEAVRAGGRVRRGRLQFGQFARIDVELPVRINPVVRLDRERLTRRALRVVVADCRVRVVAVDVGVFRPRDVDLLEVDEVVARRCAILSYSDDELVPNSVLTVKAQLRPAVRY